MPSPRPKRKLPWYNPLRNITSRKYIRPPQLLTGTSPFGKLTSARGPWICLALASYARAASSSLLKSPMTMSVPFCLIRAFQRPSARASGAESCTQQQVEGVRNKGSAGRWLKVRGLTLDVLQRRLTPRYWEVRCLASFSPSAAPLLLAAPPVPLLALA